MDAPSAPGGTPSLLADREIALDRDLCAVSAHKEHSPGDRTEL
jgi:hypothetical protein